jgi:hypothetical protein
VQLLDKLADNASKGAAQIKKVAEAAKPGTAGWSPVNSPARRLVKVRADRGSSARWSN